MGINLRAIYQLTMLAVPHLIASKGAIVNVSSVNGIRSVCKNGGTKKRKFLQNDNNAIL
jgi:NAD(P)-dependent dehydrogenase (short-subunit alcohol dehydrogenase family)